MKLLLLFALSGCMMPGGNEPIFYERDASGVYPHSVAVLNGEPTFFVGIKHHITRTAK